MVKVSGLNEALALFKDLHKTTSCGLFYNPLSKTVYCGRCKLENEFVLNTHGRYTKKAVLEAIEELEKLIEDLDN